MQVQTIQTNIVFRVKQAIFY